MADERYVDAYVVEGDEYKIRDTGLRNSTTEFLRPYITKQPTNIKTKIGWKEEFVCEAANASWYQWQYSKDGSKWNNSTVSTAGQSHMTLTMTETNTQNYYRCKVRGGLEEEYVYSNVISITVDEEMPDRTEDRVTLIESGIDLQHAKELVAVMQTYKDAQDAGTEFLYAQTGTAIDKNYDPLDPVKKIDCSTYVILGLMGVTYENSPYNGKELTIGDQTWSYNFREKGVRTAAQLCEFLEKAGCGLRIPEWPAEYEITREELKELGVKAGDVIFISRDASTGGFANNGRYKGISHVQVVKDINEKYLLMEVTAAGENTVQMGSVEVRGQNIVSICRPELTYKVNKVYEEPSLIIDVQNKVTQLTNTVNTETVQQMIIDTMDENPMDIYGLNMRAFPDTPAEDITYESFAQFAYNGRIPYGTIDGKPIINAQLDRNFAHVTALGIEHTLTFDPDTGETINTGDIVNVTEISATRDGETVIREANFLDEKEVRKLIKEESTKEDLSDDVKRAIGNLLLDGLYNSADHANDKAVILAWINGTQPDTPTPTRILQSITATYTGGDVDAGTQATELTGITVTGHYNVAPLTETVTGWTISGIVEEGQNTFTISYDGKTATITVTGITPSADPLYHFENFSKTISNAVINITDDNKISLDFTAGGGTMYTTLSDMITTNVTSLTGGAGLKAGTEWFKIPAGADVEIWLEDIEANNISGSSNLGMLGLFDNTSSNWSGSMICGFMNNLVSLQRALNGEHTTYKATEEKSVRCLGCNLTLLAGAKIEAKVCVTINGVRYI